MLETVQIHLAKIYANTNAAVCATRDAARAATEGDADALASQVMAPSVDVLNIWLGKAITGQQIP